MTNLEAIDVLMASYNFDLDPQLREAIRMGIKALEQQQQLESRFTVHPRCWDIPPQE